MISSVVLTVGDKVHELPVVEGTDGRAAIDVRTLRARTGLVILDEGFGSTAACRSAITYLDGEKSILRHRGYGIEALAGEKSFLEVAYLLLYGELPSEAEKAVFIEAVAAEATLPDAMASWFEALPAGADPMAVLAAAMSVVGTYYGSSVDLYDREAVRLAIVRILGKLPTMVATTLRRTGGREMAVPGAEPSYVGRFLGMLLDPAQPLAVSETLARRALEAALVLQADHEQNTSTTAARVVGSTYASPYAVVAAALGALSGPRHGGASQAVLGMLHQIAHGDGVASFVERVKRKDSDALLMGFGHRVYAHHDPRAVLLKREADALREALTEDDPLLAVAAELEQLSRDDDFFIERELEPNIDFYACIVYRALGFPSQSFPALFALGRVAGWLAQWHEMMQGKPRIARPRQIYVGPKERALPKR